MTDPYVRTLEEMELDLKRTVEGLLPLPEELRREMYRQIESWTGVLKREYRYYQGDSYPTF
ncbi:MAG: hypothetical protein HY513_04985 [Candidatus Aenigmarchaeota archaeon]|nr:hypothetical protein [Candidatus Aenigmarchaeota archaeon]